MSSFQPSQSSSAQPSSIEQIGYFDDPAGEQLDHAGRVELLAVDFVDLLGRVVELGRGRVHGDPDLLARLVAGLFDRGEDHVDRGGVVRQIGREAAFVADGRAEPLVVQHLLEMVEDLAAATDRVAEPLEAQRHDHELLHVDRVVGVLAAVDDVHHRRGQQPGVRAADVAIERQAAVLGRRVGRGQRHAQDRVRAELLLVRRAVQLAEHLVDADLIERVGTDQLVGDLLVDVGDRLRDAFAQVDLLVAVAQLPSLVDAGARAAGDRGGADRAVVERDVDFDGGIAAAIENLASVNVNNHAHGELAFPKPGET